MYQVSAGGKRGFLLFKGPFFWRPLGFGALCLISIPYQCTGTDLLACESDALSSSAHPPQRSISGLFPLSGEVHHILIIFLLRRNFYGNSYSKGWISERKPFFSPFGLNLPAMSKYTTWATCCKLQQSCKSGNFANLVTAFAIYSFTYLLIYESIPIFYRLYKLLHASRGSAKWIRTSSMSQQTGVCVVVQFASIVFWYMAS